MSKILKNSFQTHHHFGKLTRTLQTKSDMQTSLASFFGQNGGKKENPSDSTKVKSDTQARELNHAALDCVIQPGLDVGNTVRCFRALQHVLASFSEAQPIVFEGHLLAALWYGTFDQDAQAPQEAQKSTARVFDSSPHWQHRKPAATAYPFDFTSNFLSKYSAPSLCMSADVRSALGLSGTKKSPSNGNAPTMSFSTNQQSRQNEQFQKFCKQRRAESRSSAESEPLLAKSDAALVTSSDAVMLGSLLSDVRVGNTINSHDSQSFSDALSATLKLHSRKITHVSLDRTGVSPAVLEFYINSLACMAHQAGNYRLPSRHHIFARYIMLRIVDSVFSMNVEQLQTLIKLCLHLIGAGCCGFDDNDSALFNDVAAFLWKPMMYLLFLSPKTIAQPGSPQSLIEFLARARQVVHSADTDPQDQTLSAVIPMHEMCLLQNFVSTQLGSVLRMWNQCLPFHELLRAHQVLISIVNETRQSTFSRMVRDCLLTVLFVDLLLQPIPIAFTKESFELAPIVQIVLDFYVDSSSDVQQSNETVSVSTPARQRQVFLLSVLNFANDNDDRPALFKQIQEYYPF